MKKKLFLALLTTLLLLLAATAALAVSPSDYNCTLCGEPCTEWYPAVTSESTVCYHAPLCTSCRAIVWEGKTPCTPVKGTATCINEDLCSVCGFPDTVNGVPNPNAHHLCDWVYDSSQQHYRYCTYCGADDTYEYEDHSGGKATCITPAVCEVCNSGYGELSTEHAFSEWEQCSAKEHQKYCILCCGGDTFLYEKHYGGTATCLSLAVCEGCGASYGALSEEHLNLTAWSYFSGQEHYRWCLACNQGYEYERHYGGTATCTEPAVCEGCGEPYADELGHDWSEWSSNPDGTHTRFCRRDVSHTETADCVWGEWVNPWSGVHERSCTSGCGAVQSDSCYGGKATCTSLAVCEACSAEYGSTDPDVHGEYSGWMVDIDCHYMYCLDCGAGYIYAVHNGGTATCSSWAVCVDCGAEYGGYDENAHAWSDWTPYGGGIHVRTCAINSFHMEYGFCEWSAWTLLDETYHARQCSVCNWKERSEHTGGTVTCAQMAICQTCGEGYGQPDPDAHDWSAWVSDGNGQHTRTCRNDASHTETEFCYGGRAFCNAPAVCEGCGEPYGGPDNSSLPNHPNPIYEFRPATCYEEGYFRIICDAPGCTLPFYEILSLAIGQHIYNHWDAQGDHLHHTDCAVCGEDAYVDCTLWGMMNGDALLTVCPVCGDFPETPFGVLIARDDAAVPIGTLLVRGIEAPFDGVLYAITVAGVYGGEVVDVHGPVTITIPVSCEGFTLVRVEIAQDTEVRTELPFTLEEGQMTFETDAAGLFLLVPAE